MIAGLDTLLIALCVELTGRIIAVHGFTRRGPGGPAVTGAGLACIAVAQVLVRLDDGRHWPRIGPRLSGHLVPGCWPTAGTTPGCGSSRR